MSIKDLRLLSREELKNKLETLAKQLMDLEFRRKTGVEKPHLFKQVKRGIAQLHTVLNEKKREEEKNA
ncbi:MAG: 50S ribosomal protein L29 [Candidatus Omnitrophica bacterium]|nr:50S ribosomal protein L29 [Candidatus Omnitrophota bacterium]